MECPLCNALKEERLIYEDEHCFCIVNLDLLNDTHLMVLPKRHVYRLDELTSDEKDSMLKLLERLSRVMIENEQEPPFIALNRGKNCSQEHLHFHILATKGLRFLYSQVHNIPLYPKSNTDKMKEIANRFSKLLE